MRVEGCSTVILRGERRSRFIERRASGTDRRRRETPERRARHTAPLWFAPAFGAHILGQIAPETVAPEQAARAYLQPEARTPLRPSIVTAKA